MEERLAKILTGPRNPNPVTLTRKFGVVHPYRPLELWESTQGNQNVLLLARGTFCERLRVACTKAVAAEREYRFNGTWNGGMG